MRTWMMTLIAATGMLWATSASADWRDGRDDRGGYENRRGDHDNRWRGTDRLDRVAYDLDVSAQNLKALAQRRAHHGDRDEAEGIRAVEKFAERASTFRRHLQDRRSFDRLDRDLEKLRESFARVERKLDELHPDRRTQDEFYRTRDAMNRLNRVASRRGFDGRSSREWWQQLLQPQQTEPRRVYQY